MVLQVMESKLPGISLRSWDLNYVYGEAKYKVRSSTDYVTKRWRSGFIHFCVIFTNFLFCKKKNREPLLIFLRGFRSDFLNKFTIRDFSITILIISLNQIWDFLVRGKETVINKHFLKFITANVTILILIKCFESIPEIKLWPSIQSLSGTFRVWFVSNNGLKDFLEQINGLFSENL